MSDYLKELIVETYQEQHPELVERIKSLVRAGETRRSFINHLQKILPENFNTSLTVSASITMFDYFKANKQKLSL